MAKEYCFLLKECYIIWKKIVFFKTKNVATRLLEVVFIIYGGSFVEKTMHLFNENAIFYFLTSFPLLHLILHFGTRMHYVKFMLHMIEKWFLFKRK